MRARVRFAAPGSTGLIEAGWISGKRPIFPRRRFHAWCLVLVTGGGGRHQGLHGTQAVSAGDLLVVVPGEAHRYGAGLDGAWSEAFLSMTGPLAEGLVRELILPAEGRVLPEVPAAFRRGFQDIVDRFLANGADGDGRMLADLHLLAATSLRARGGDRGWLAAAQAILASRLDRPLAMAEAVAASGLAARSFRQRFRAATGMPPARYRLHCRLAEARRLLVEGQDRIPLAEIATATGFCSPFQLSRIYRAHIGHAPSQDRGGRPT